MDRLEYIVPCHFGLEAVLKREIADLGYEVTAVEDGRVTFSRGALALLRANIFFRGRRLCPGAITYRRTVNSGWRRRPA